MPTRSVNGSGLRAGAEALSLLAAPLNVKILKALSETPTALLDLRRATGSPPSSTLRLYLRTLEEIGLVERKNRAEFPTSVDYRSTTAGQGLLEVGRVLEAWLRDSPYGPIDLGSVAARNAVKALVEGWTTNIVRALAARRLSLTELNGLIPRVSYPALERRLAALRLFGLVDGERAEGRNRPYRATEWLRRASVPLVAAIAWERRYLPGSSSPVGRLDVEAVFLLAVPLMELPQALNGRCRLAVEVQRGSAPAFAGVVVCLEAGKPISCSPHLKGEVDGWAAGPPAAWLRQLNATAERELELGGDIALAEAIIQGLASTAHELQRSI